ncbi:MAG: dynamin family protein [Bacteroidales bacterium]|nr:dynamin family protein [Candidatus Sodaliphilus limicaballi]
MSYLDELHKIAEDLQMVEQAKLLSLFKQRIESPNKEVLIPLVGEFSSGKTSFINAILDNKTLETASKATTATIFEIRCGSDSYKQEIIDLDGNLIDAGNETLSNTDLQETTQVVRVYDTSSKLDSSIVLVDTPGLSSNDPKHRIALSNYLPNADAILLVVDVNQSATRSLISFVKDSQISKRPIFLMLTKCDTKTSSEVAQQLKNTVEIVGVPETNIICTSAQTGNLDQFFELVKKIQIQKNQIVNNAINDRVKLIAEQMKDFIQDLINSLESSTDLEAAINEQSRKLKQFNKNIDELIEDAAVAIENKEEAAIRSFKDRVSRNLDSILQNEGRDCDQSVYASVNSVGNMIIESYRKDLQSVLVNLGRQRRHSAKEIPMQSLETIDLSGVAFNQFSYDLDLSSLGHEHDKAFGYTALAVAAVAAVAVAAPMVAPMVAAGGAAGGAAAAGTASAAGTAAAGGAAASAGTAVASTIVSETGEIVAGTMISRAITKARNYAGEVSTQMSKIQDADRKLQQKLGTNRGLIETATGWVTDKIVGKPARVRAVNNYLDSTLVPEFRNLLFNVRTNLLRIISDTIRLEADSQISSMEQALVQMKEQLDDNKQVVAQRREELKSYIEIINEYK